MVQKKYITFGEIRKGDTILVSFTNLGCDMTRRSVAHTMFDIGDDPEIKSPFVGNVWTNDQAAVIVGEIYRCDNVAIELIHRPKPPLPTEPGSIIVVTASHNPWMDHFTPLTMFRAQTGLWHSTENQKSYPASYIKDWYEVSTEPPKEV